jgi:serine/threonine protein kinase
MAKSYRAFDGDDYIGRALRIGGHVYSILTTDIRAVGGAMAIAYTGKKATVYKVKGDSSDFALKVFHKRFALRDNVWSTFQLLPYSKVPGLKVCKREIICDSDAYGIDEPGLAFAICMPWISGKSWEEILIRKEGLSQQQCIAIARKTASVLKGLEDRKLVHADVSSSNVFIELGSSPRVELIDVEDMYHPNFIRVSWPPDGSPGYNHPGNEGNACQNPYGDRFAGAVLLAEMLTWHQPKIRSESEESSYFHSQREMCKSDHPKYYTVVEALQAHSMAVADLFNRAWHSKGLADCPRLSEWHTALKGVKETSKQIGTDTLAGLVTSRSFLEILLESGPGSHTRLVPDFVCTECGKRVRPDTPADHALTCSEHPSYFRPALDIGSLFRDPSVRAKSLDYLQSVVGRYLSAETYTCDECGNVVKSEDDRAHGITCSHHPDYKKRFPGITWQHFLETEDDTGLTALYQLLEKTGKKSGSFEKIWVDQNVYEKAGKGMKIHAKFTVRNVKNVRCRAVAYFHFDSGEPLKDFNDSYYTIGGHVSVGVDFTPSYDDSVFKDFTLFIPYSELHLDKGKHNLRFKIDLHDHATNTHFAISDYVYFQATQH